MAIKINHKYHMLHGSFKTGKRWARLAVMVIESMRRSGRNLSPTIVVEQGFFYTPYYKTSFNIVNECKNDQPITKRNLLIQRNIIPLS